MTTVKLVTVDIWDTLLRRNCQPDAVKLHVAKYLLLNHYAMLKPYYCDTWALLYARRRCEDQLAKHNQQEGFDGEYRLRDVYGHWLKTVFKDPESRIMDDICADLEIREFEQEKTVTYADRFILAVVNRFAGSQKLFVSDFYMKSEVICQLLKCTGMGEKIGLERGYVSCEHYLNKRSGRLFGLIHQREQVNPSEHVHIGDSYQADVLAPARMGIRTIQHLPHSERLARARKEKYFEDRAAGTRALMRQTALQVATPAELGRLQRDLFRYGVTCAPLFVGFVLFVQEEAIKNKLEKIFFFTREGEFFKKVYDKLQVAFGQTVPPAVVLDASRVSTFAPSLTEISCHEMMRMWNLYSTQSMSAMFASLNIGMDDYSDLFRRYDVAPLEPIQHPWLDSRVVRLFSDPTFTRMMALDVGSKKARLLAYLSSRGFGKSKKVGVADIGWRGTIQDNLTRLYPDIQVLGFYMGQNEYLNDQPANSVKKTFGPDLNLPHEKSVEDVFQSVTPIEMLCNSPHGSPVNYAVGNGKVTALVATDEHENFVFDKYVSFFQQGALASVPALAQTIRDNAIMSSELRAQALAIWQSIILRPPKFVAEAYFSLRHNEQFGLGSSVDKSYRLRSRAFAIGLFVSTERQRIYRYIESTGWIQGYLSLHKLDFMMRLYVLLHKRRALIQEVTFHLGKLARRIFISEALLRRAVDLARHMVRKIARAAVERGFRLPLPRSRRLLFHTDRFERGGLERVIELTAGALATGGRIARIGANEFSGIVPDGKRLIGVGVPRQAVFLLAERPAAVVGHSFSAFQLVAHGLGIRWIQMLHNCPAWVDPHWMPVIRRRLLAADGVWAVSARVRDYTERVLEIPAGRIRVIPNPIQVCSPSDSAQARLAVRAAWRIPSDAVLLLCVARQEATKGLGHLLQALPHLRPRYPALVVAFVGGEGDVGYSLRLQRLVERLGLREQVLWLDWQGDVNRWYAAADLFVLPSLLEGSSLAAAEALASGLPCVLTRVGDADELAAMTGAVVLLDPPQGTYLDIQPPNYDWCLTAEFPEFHERLAAAIETALDRLDVLRTLARENAGRLAAARSPDAIAQMMSAELRSLGIE